MRMGKFYTGIMFILLSLAACDKDDEVSTETFRTQTPIADIAYYTWDVNGERFSTTRKFASKLGDAVIIDGIAGDKSTFTITVNGKEKGVYKLGKKNEPGTATASIVYRSAPYGSQYSDCTNIDMAIADGMVEITDIGEKRSDYVKGSCDLTLYKREGCTLKTVHVNGAFNVQRSN